MIFAENDLKEIGIHEYGVIPTVVVCKDLGLPSGCGDGEGMPGTMPCL